MQQFFLIRLWIEQDFGRNHLRAAVFDGTTRTGFADLESLQVYLREQLEAIQTGDPDEQ